MKALLALMVMLAPLRAVHPQAPSRMAPGAIVIGGERDEGGVLEPFLTPPMGALRFMQLGTPYAT